MKIKKLKLKNIRSYEDQEIEFPEGSLLLSGDVGSGKTSILLAIEYALFSLQPGQKGSSLLRNETQLGEVSLEFEVDGKEIIIERRLKRKEKTVSNSYSAITIDGEKIVSSVTEIKTKVLKLLGYPPEFIKRNNILYRYTVYTPQEQMKQIILEDSETRLNLLRHIFGIDKYKRVRENLTILSSYLKETSKSLQGEIKTIDKDKEYLSNYKNRLVTISQKINENQFELEGKIKQRKSIEFESKELETKIREKEKLESEVEKTGLLIMTKKGNVSSLDKDAVELLKGISEVGIGFQEEKLNYLIEQLALIEQKNEEFNSKYIETIGRINSLEQSKNSSLSRRERIFQIDICPTCLQDVSETHKHNIMNEAEREIAQAKESMGSLERERKLLSETLGKQKEMKSELEEEKLIQEVLKSKIGYLEKSRKRLLEIEKQKENAEKDVLLLEEHLNNLKENILKFSRFTNFYRLKQEELKTAFVMEKNSEISLAELKKEFELTQAYIHDLEGAIQEREKSKSKLSEVLELNDWLSGQFSNLIEYVERNVMMKLRTEFSKLFSKWFNILVASDSFRVHLDENFTPLIIQGETEMDYTFLSGGERTAIALAYRLALNQTINSILSKIKTRDIVILDEPTDGFSEAQLEKMRSVLDELNVSQLIIVSHEQKIEGFVDSVLKIKKESDCSFLEAKTPSHKV